MKASAWLAALASLMICGTAQATLIDRGAGLVYDDALDVTWLMDANYVATSHYNLSLDGRLTYSQALAWADQLEYAGYTDWRLPDMDRNGDHSVAYCSLDVDCLDNEYGHMFWQNLNGTPVTDLVRNLMADGGVTLNNIGDVYWSSTTLGPGADGWAFGFNSGNQTSVGSSYAGTLWAWGVRDGDVLTQPPTGVPEPGTLALLGAVALGWLGVRRRRAAAAS